MRIMLDDFAIEPERAHATDAGLDLKATQDFEIRPGDYHIEDTGVHVELPPQTAGMIKSKSGLNVRRDIITEGVIDEGYTGSIIVKMYNLGNEVQKFRKGDKITQLVILPVVVPRTIEIVREFTETERGNRGFGSSGR